MDPIYSKLEYDIILKNISDLAPAQTVAEQILLTEPVSSMAQAEKQLERTSDALSILASRRPDLMFDDIDPLISKAKVGAVLQPGELLKIKNNISALRSLKNCVETSDGCDSLKDITAWVRACDDLEREIGDAVENETDLKDTASDKLYTLRRAIMRANSRLKERLDGYTRQSDVSKYLQDNIVTIRDGRYVVPVRAECRSNVKGLVHDVSATGATVFIEPFAIVEANNEIKTLRTEELIEIERILTDLGNSVVKNATALTDGQNVLIECGIIFAKAEYAKKLDAFRPVLNDSGRIVLKGARHPLIPQESVVPVNISLTDKSVLLISGPNTGGKTVALKTVGLFALMAASGIFLPALEGSEMCVFENIYCDIGDSQSISQSLSTFSAHITNIAAITSVMNEKSLVLLDEVGDGTDPDEGAALAIAIIKNIIQKKSTAIITTHFNSVKDFALKNSAIENACMQFDNVNFKPTYKLLQGVSGSSYALEIAEKLGLDKSIIKDAIAAMSSEKTAFNEILREAERLRNEAMRDREQIEKTMRKISEDARAAEKNKLEYERKLNEVKEKSRNMILQRADEYSERAEALIDEIKQSLKKADEAALFEARKSANKIREDIPADTVEPKTSKNPPLASDLSNGTRVYIEGLNQEGTVVGKPRGNKVVVAIGQIKTDVPISSVTVIKTEKATKNHREKAFDGREPVTQEIMLLGKTVDEAIEEIDRVLYDIPPKSVLRIVHGKGTGALGRGVQAYLKHNAKIKNYRYGRYGEGELGVTIAEIK